MSLRASRRRATLLGAVGLLLVAGLTGSCKPPRTQMLVVIDTDIPECHLAAIHLRCAYNWDPSLGDPSSLTCDYPFQRGTGTATIHLPGSLGVTANEALPNDPFTLVIDDSSSLAVPLLRRIVQVHFTQHETTQLVVRLAAACQAPGPVSATHPCPTGLSMCTLSQSCEARGQTCGNEGTCRPIAVDTSELQVIPVGTDAGLPDSGADDAAMCHD